MSQSQKNQQQYKKKRKKSKYISIQGPTVKVPCGSTLARVSLKTHIDCCPFTTVVEVKGWLSRFPIASTWTGCWNNTTCTEIRDTVRTEWETTSLMTDHLVVGFISGGHILKRDKGGHLGDAADGTHSHVQGRFGLVLVLKYNIIL